MPYSVSTPTKPGLLTSAGSQVLTGVDVVDGASGRVVSSQQGADVDDALALFPGDPRPVVGVGGVGKILVLAELLPDGGQQILGHQTAAARLEQALDGELLGPGHDVVDHGPGVEVLEVQDLLLAVG